MHGQSYYYCHYLGNEDSEVWGVLVTCSRSLWTQVGKGPMLDAGLAD